MNLKNEIIKYDAIKSAAEAGHEMEMKVFVVGGFVRDILLDRKRDEIDFLIVGDGPKFASVLGKKLGQSKISIFKNFGTAHFKYEDLNLEFVGARKESYKKDSRNPSVAAGSFYEDISRRDFTINTLAVSLNEENYGELIDTFNGFDDLKKKLIKTPVDPKITFDDDPLRILRAFRFAAQLGFEVDKSIMDAAELLRERLSIVSQERITDEFLKILAAPKPSLGLQLLHDSRAMEIVFPELSELKGVEQRQDFHHKDVFIHTLLVVDNISEATENIWLRFAALVHDIAKPATKKFVEGVGWTFHGHDEIGARMLKEIFKRMKLPLIHLHYVEKLVRMHLRPISLSSEDVTDSAIRRLVVSAGNDLEDLITLCRADITSKNPDKVNKYLENYERVMKRVLEVEELDKLRAFQSPVSGEVIMKVCNLNPSRKVGEIKKAIEEAILDGKIKNTYENAYAYLLTIKDDFLEQG